MLQTSRKRLHRVDIASPGPRPVSQRVAPGRTTFRWARVFVVGVVLVLGAATFDAAAHAADGHDWPRFLGPNGDATSRETGILTTWPSEGLKIVWQMPLGEGYANVSVADGQAFAFDREGDQVRLIALDARTGDEIWRQTYGTQYEDTYGYSGGPRAVPVIDGDRVYAFGVDGRLRAHQTRDGKVLWDIDTNARYGVLQNFFGAGSAPVVDGALLIVAIGGSPKDSPAVSTGSTTANGSAIVAFDKRTGEERYRLGDELASYASPRIVDIGDRRVGLHFARGGLLGFDPIAGKQLFHFPWRAKMLESVNAATPVVVGDRVFLTEVYGPGSVLLRLTGTDLQPEVVWKGDRRNPKLPSHWATPIHHEGTLYGATGRGTGDAALRAVDLETGAVRWTTNAPGRSSLLLVDGHLVVLGEYGELWLVEASPERFRKVAEMTPKDAEGRALLRHPVWNAPVLAHGLLYLRGKDGVVAVELIPKHPPAETP